MSSELTRVLDVQTTGPITVFRRTTAGDKTAKLIVREHGREWVLLDPNLSAGSVLAINNIAPAPDGKLVAVHQTKPRGTGAAHAH